MEPVLIVAELMERLKEAPPGAPVFVYVDSDGVGVQAEDTEGGGVFYILRMPYAPQCGGPAQ